MTQPPRQRPRFGLPPITLALVVLAATSLALLGVGRLRLRADLASLLPDGTPVAEAYRSFFEHFDGLELIFVVVEAATSAPTGSVAPADLVRAAAALEAELATRPELTDVRAGITARDERFLLEFVAPRAPMLINDEERAALASRLTPAAIRARVKRLRARLATPAGAFHRRWAPNDPLGLAAALPAMGGTGSLPLDPWTSVFLSPAGDAALVIATPTAPELDPAGGRAVAAAIEQACAEVAANTGIAVRCRAVGGPLYAAQDERLLRHDLRRTLYGSLIATSTVLIIAFEGLLLPLAVLVPLLVGLLWGAGWLGWWSPEISAVAIGFGAVLIGLGVDYAIHLAARFRHHYSKIPAHEIAATEIPARLAALASAVGECGPGIATSALTTAAGFAVLCLARLPPLREVGLLVAIGIVAVLAAITTTGGAMLLAVAPRMSRPGAAWRHLGRLVDAIVALAARRAWVVVVLATVGSVAATWALLSLTLDANPRALRPADPPTRAVETILANRFGVGLDTAHVLVNGASDGEALDRARAVTEMLRASLPPTATVSSPSDYLSGGDHQRQRLQALRALPFTAAADELERALTDANLDPRAFATGLEALRAFGRGEDPGPPPATEWPSWLASSLDHEAARTWASVAIRLPMGTWPSGPPAGLQAQLNSVAPGAAPVVVIAAAALGDELQTLAASDLRRLALLALAAIGTVVVISFRGRLVPSALALLPVVLGTLWTLGGWAALGRPLDLFCLAVLPILLGIGIDDGLHVMHGAQSASPATGGGATGGGVRHSLRGAGRALLLTTVTTVAGFASLLLSDIPGLRNGGALIAVGVSACWLATMFVLPAIEALTTHGGAHHKGEASAPPVGLLRRWLSALNITGIFWFRIHRWGTRVVPTWLIGPTVLVFTLFFFVVLRRARAAVASNLVPVLGPCGWWQKQVRIFKTLWSFAWCLTERYEQLSTERRVSVEIEGEANWRQALDNAQGFILVTAHIGHWEIGSMLAPGRHVHVVREEEVDPRSQDFMREMYAEPTSDTGFTDTGFTMHFAHQDPMLGMKLLAALRRGEIVALQGDRPRTGGRVLTTEIFGRPFAMPLGPPALARAAGVALLPAYVFRVGRYRSRVVIKPPIRVSAPGPEGLAEAAGQISAEIEWAVRHEPHQWFCFRELWPNDFE